MKIDPGQGYLLAHTIQSVAAVPKFPLEGRNRDLFEALQPHSEFVPDGPVFPTLGSRLFPALDAMDKTVEALGKHPTPEEVDRSNLRRLIRAIEPLLETYRDCYAPDDFDRAHGELKSVGKALGRYKDIAVVESEATAVHGDSLPKKLAKKLKRSREKRAKKFAEAYRRFRKKGLKRAAEVLHHPRLRGIADPRRLEAEDKERMADTVQTSLKAVRQRGLEHYHPTDFHAARKALRAALNAVNAAAGTFEFDADTVERTTDLVDSYGRAQDAEIAREWLKAKGFKKEARAAGERYQVLQQQALTQGIAFERDDLAQLQPITRV